MKRLVYSPKVTAYVKTDLGIVDISEYIVSGSVTRRINAISSAEIVLRNPNFRFTQQVINDQATKEREVRPMFHPMDPIVITLTRIKNYPVQVFTGYLDTVPYLQLYPGTCRVTASCTLKRLSHTWWDPALPYSLSFLSNYGWDLADSSGTLRNSAAEEVVRDGDLDVDDPTGKKSEKPKDKDSDKDADGKPKKPSKLEDASFSKLLEGTLEHVGGWDWSTIHIGELPETIIPLVSDLYDEIKDNSVSSKKEFDTFLEKIIGKVTGGGGGMPGGGGAPGDVELGGGTRAQQIFCYFVNSGINEIGAAAFVGNFHVETGGTFDPAIQQGGGGPGRGIAQWTDTDRWATLVSFAKNRNVSPTNLKTQLDFVMYELNNGYESVYKAVKNATSIDNAVVTIVSDYERAGVWGDRTSPAHAAYKKFKGTCGSPKAAGSPSHPGARPGASASTAPANTAVPVAGTSRRGNSQQGDPAGRDRPANRDGGGDGQETAHEASKRMAKEVLRHRNVSFPLVSPTGGDASGTLKAVAEGKCAPVAATGECTAVSLQMLAYMLKALEGGGVGINCLNNATHSSGSDHYQGRAIDIDESTGRESALLSLGARMGGTSSGESYSGHAHIHLSFNGGQMSDSGAPANFNEGPGGGGSGGGGGGGSSSGGGMSYEDVIAISKASAFATFLEGPSVMEIAEAVSLSGQKSLMNDKPLLPFIEQIATASLRNFMSLPNGHFFAFYPDYFGGLGRQPYWDIEDIEILDGKIDLTDDALATHVFVVGDTVGMNGIDIADRLQSGGVINIFNAFGADFINGPLKVKEPVQRRGNRGEPTKAQRRAEEKAEQVEAIAEYEGMMGGSVAPNLRNFLYATDFLKKYGARPKYVEQPLVRSPYYETFLAYQTFCLTWAEQFLTQFTFTFMPEIFPGGLVTFSAHGIQCYVQEVQHTFDYANGFHTQASLMAPSAIDARHAQPIKGINQGMVRSFSFDDDNIDPDRNR